MVRKGDASRIQVIRGRTQRGARDFERLYRESYGLVYNYVSFRMAGDQAAEDVTAEAFIKAARAFARFDPAHAKFSTWVISIARNCMADHWRRTRPTSALDDVPEGAFSASDEYPGLDDNAALVKGLLGKLNDADRELVFLKYYEGKRNVEIARELGINESTVGSRLQRALAKMRAAAERGE